MSDLSCPGNSSNCTSHFHVEDPSCLEKTGPKDLAGDLEAGRSTTSATPVVSKEAPRARHSVDKNDVGFRRIIRNFTPS
jgi:hypothetical protein